MLDSVINGPQALHVLATKKWLVNEWILKDIIELWLTQKTVVFSDSINIWYIILGFTKIVSYILSFALFSI